MRNFKRILAFLMVVALLASVPVATSAESGSSEVIDETVLHSITVEEETGRGLAFRIKMNVNGAGVNARNEFINTDATVTIDSEVYHVVKMGAVMVNTADNIAKLDSWTVEDADGAHILDVPAKYLCEEPDADSCVFAVRIINLPAAAQGRAIACRPYIVLEKDGVETTIYGAGDISTYNANYYSNVPEETPVLEPSIANVDAKITVSDVSAAYVAYETTNYAEAFEVSLTLTNTTTNAKPSAGDYITYAFKDAEGNVLGNEKVNLDTLTVGVSETVSIYAPIGTATIEVAEKELTYVPDIVLPEIGSDIDVTKKKNRIRVSAADASFNEDGTIHVSLTFTNYTTNWITEETDYIKYSYYKGDTRKGTATLYIGVIDTKKNKTKTYEFDVPSYTTKVSITSSKIVYWTEWA